MGFFFKRLSVGKVVVSVMLVWFAQGFDSFDFKVYFSFRSSVIKDDLIG